MYSPLYRIEARGQSGARLVRRARLVNHNTPTPLFFCKVESKGLSDPVSSLVATLTGDFISVILNNLGGNGKSKSESGNGENGRSAGF